MERWNFGANFGTGTLEPTLEQWNFGASNFSTNIEFKKTQHEQHFEKTLKKLKHENQNSGTVELYNNHCQETFADSHLKQVSVPGHWLPLKGKVLVVLKIRSKSSPIAQTMAAHFLLFSQCLVVCGQFGQPMAKTIQFQESLWCVVHATKGIAFKSPMLAGLISVQAWFLMMNQNNQNIL